MDQLTNDLKAEIDAFLKESGMGPTYFGTCAVKNSRLVERLEAGGSVELRTAEKIREFIAKRREQ